MLSKHAVALNVEFLKDFYLFHIAPHARLMEK